MFGKNIAMKTSPVMRSMLFHQRMRNNIIFLFTLNNFNFLHPKDDPSLLDILVNNHAVTCSVSVCMCVIHNPDIPE
jgi:hypothetical protein